MSSKLKFGDLVAGLGGLLLLVASLLNQVSASGALGGGGAGSAWSHRAFLGVLIPVDLAGLAIGLLVVLVSLGKTGSLKRDQILPWLRGASVALLVTAIFESAGLTGWFGSGVSLSAGPYVGIAGAVLLAAGLVLEPFVPFLATEVGGKAAGAQSTPPAGGYPVGVGGAGQPAGPSYGGLQQGAFNPPGSYGAGPPAGYGYGQPGQPGPAQPGQPGPSGPAQPTGGYEPPGQSSQPGPWQRPSQPGPAAAESSPTSDDPSGRFVVPSPPSGSGGDQGGLTPAGPQAPESSGPVWASGPSVAAGSAAPGESADEEPSTADESSPDATASLPTAAQAAASASAGQEAAQGESDASSFSPFWAAVPTPRPLYRTDDPAAVVGTVQPGSWYAVVAQHHRGLIFQLPSGETGVVTETDDLFKG